MIKPKTMKLQLGKRYVTNGGQITAPLKNNPKRSINYPFLDDSTGGEYTEDGESWDGVHDSFISSRYYDSTPPEDNTILSMMGSDYEALKRENDQMRAFVKDVVKSIQNLREVHTRNWNELPQSVKDFIAE